MTVAAFFAVLILFGVPIAAIVDVARFPEWAFDQAGGEPKSTWLAGPLLSVFCCWVFGIGMVIYWFFGKRAKVTAAMEAGNEPTQTWL